MKLFAVVSLVFLVAACSNNDNKSAATPQAPPSALPLPPLGAVNYPGQQLNATTALRGMGRWETIDGQDYFVPALQNQNDWMPYRNGQWGWDDKDGWTWVSQDRFGWMTDHYGVWRHHAHLKWVWQPFSDMHYEPHCVTWFENDGHIGWYPYHSRSDAVYRRHSRGFDDGFWIGADVVGQIGQPGFQFQMGFTIVDRTQITSPNFRSICGPRLDQRSAAIVAGAHSRNGFMSSLPHRNHIENFAQFRPAIVNSQGIPSRGGALIRTPQITSAPMTSQPRQHREPPRGPPPTHVGQPRTDRSWGNGTEPDRHQGQRTDPRLKHREHSSRNND